MLRFNNGLTWEAGTLTENEVWIEGREIRYVGPEQPNPAGFEREIDLQGNLLLPGFKNAHSHAAMTFLRSAADDLPLQRWLTEKVFPLEARLTPENILPFIKIAYLEYLAGGVTACLDMYFHRPATAALAEAWGFRHVIAGGLSFDDDPELIARDAERFNRPGSLVSYIPGIHAEYTASPELMKAVSEVTHRLKLPVFSHNSETKAETEACIARHGCTPTRLFDDLGLYDYGGGGYHCVWFTDEDMDIFVRRGCTAVINAGSNAKLASGVFPLQRMLSKGVKLAVGTDGAASNNALDMFREMYLINVQAKLQSEDAAAGNPAKILEAAVSGGARAMGLPDCDDIAPGKQADLIVIDRHQPNLQPRHDVLNTLIYAGHPGNVKLTMIAGKILYENGQYHVGETPETIYAEAEKALKQILS